MTLIIEMDCHILREEVHYDAIQQRSNDFTVDYVQFGLFNFTVIGVRPQYQPMNDYAYKNKEGHDHELLNAILALECAERVELQTTQLEIEQIILGWVVPVFRNSFQELQKRLSHQFRGRRCCQLV